MFPHIIIGSLKEGAAIPAVSESSELVDLISFSPDLLLIFTFSIDLLTRLKVIGEFIASDPCSCIGSGSSVLNSFKQWSAGSSPFTSFLLLFASQFEFSSSRFFSTSKAFRGSLFARWTGKLLDLRARLTAAYLS